MQTINVLLIGCGNIAGGFDTGRPWGSEPLTHAGAYREHGGFVLTACMEPDESRREAFVRHWNVEWGYAGLEELSHHTGTFDIVSICSPTPVHETHLEVVRKLQPRLVFCEKPVTSSAAQTRHWVECLATDGILMAVNHNRRWAPDVARLREELRIGTWGTIRSVTGHYNKGILNNGSHLIDLIHFLLGPLECMSAGTPIHDAWDSDPSIPALLHCDGIPVQLCVGDARDYALFEMDIITSGGVIAMRDGGARWSIRKSIDNPHFNGYKGLSEPVHLTGQYAESMRYAIANIHATLHDGRPLESTGATALAAQQVCDDILAASQKPRQ